MRIGFSVIIGLALSTSASFATDLPSRKKAPDASAISKTSLPNWSGYHVGLTTSYGWNNFHYRSGFIGSDQIEAGAASGQGLQIGLRLGHDQDLGNGYLLGLIGDIALNSIDENSHCLSGDCSTSGYLGSAKLPLIGTFRSRLGMISGSNLFYITSGTGFALVQSEITNLETSASASRNEIRFAGTLGAGFERQLKGNLSLGAEYLYYKFGDRIYNYSVEDTSSRLVIGDTMSQIKVTLGYRF